MKVTHEVHQTRKSRNVGVGLVLAVLVAIVFGMTFVKLIRIGEYQRAEAEAKAAQAAQAEAQAQSTTQTTANE